MTWPTLSVNHAALLYLLHLQATFIHQLFYLFLGLVRGKWSREGGVVTETSHYI
jgi:hypothetical protein